MVEVGTSKVKGKYIRTKYPVTEGLTAGTTKLKKKYKLKPKTTVVNKRDTVGL